MVGAGKNTVVNKKRNKLKRGTVRMADFSADLLGKGVGLGVDKGPV